MAEATMTTCDLCINHQKKFCPESHWELDIVSGKRYCTEFTMINSWSKLKEILNTSAESWRERQKKYPKDEFAEYYVDAYMCVLHNMEHIEKGEV